MDRPHLWILLHTYALSGVLGRHIFVGQTRRWSDAQRMCRAEFTDLSPVDSAEDTERLSKASGGTLKQGWVGLHKHKSVWRWSGGGVATDYLQWNVREPNNYRGNETAVEILRNGKWNDALESSKRSVFCIRLTVVRETMRWEEALEHCRQQEGDLLGMPSDTRLLLALRELQKTPTVQRVWIGLRYLGNRWLWVNGDPMRFQGWSTAGTSPDAALPQQPHCPGTLDGSCGAMNRQGVWEAHDCQERLNFICD